jgi:hypothetical protein
MSAVCTPDGPTRTYARLKGYLTPVRMSVSGLSLRVAVEEEPQLERVGGDEP